MSKHTLLPRSMHQTLCGSPKSKQVQGCQGTLTYQLPSLHFMLITSQLPPPLPCRLVDAGLGAAAGAVGEHMWDKHKMKEEEKRQERLLEERGAYPGGVAEGEPRNRHHHGCACLHSNFGP